MTNVTEIDEVEEALSNSGEGMSRQKFNAQVRALGTAEGKGAVSRPMLAILIAHGAWHEAITEEDVEKAWASHQQYAADHKGMAYVKAPTFKTQVSKLKAPFALGKLTQVEVPILLDNAQRVYGEARDALGGKAPPVSAFDFIINVARRQKDQPSVMLTDDEMFNMVFEGGASVTEDTQADILDKVRVTIDKVLLPKVDGKPVPCILSSEHQDMLNDFKVTLTSEINDLGGTTKEIRDAEKNERARLRKEASDAKAEEARRAAAKAKAAQAAV